MDQKVEPQSPSPATPSAARDGRPEFWTEEQLTDRDCGECSGSYSQIRALQAYAVSLEQQVESWHKLWLQRWDDLQTANAELSALRAKQPAVELQPSATPDEQTMGKALELWSAWKKSPLKNVMATRESIERWDEFNRYMNACLLEPKPSGTV